MKSFWWILWKRRRNLLISQVRWKNYNLRYLKTNNAAGKQIVVFADTTSEKNTLSHLVNISLLVSFAGLLGFPLCEHLAFQVGGEACGRSL